MGTHSLQQLTIPHPTRVICAPNGVPHAVDIAGRRRTVVAVRDQWIAQDRWWTDDPIERHFYELIVDPGRVVFVFCELRSSEWFLYGHPRAAAG